MPVRTLKFPIPEKVSVLRLPICSTILSVGLEGRKSVVWIETPEVATMKEIINEAGLDEDCWPNVPVKFEIVPTGEHASNGMKFVGTLIRPRISDPTRNAVVHIYAEQSKFIHFR